MLRALLALSCLLFVSRLPAADAPASEESIRELLAITESRSLLENLFPQLDQMMLASVNQNLGGRTLEPRERDLTEKMLKRMGALFREELSWEKMEPMYLEIYKKSFTQTEVEGIVAFYKTPAGAAMVRKMPVVMQETMAAMQERMGPIAEKIQAAVNETISEFTPPPATAP
jgi:hypothetical protein